LCPDSLCRFDKALNFVVSHNLRPLLESFQPVLVGNQKIRKRFPGNNIGKGGRVEEDIIGKTDGISACQQEIMQIECQNAVGSNVAKNIEKTCPLPIFLKNRKDVVWKIG
jgi:hypothetical protein